MKQEQTRSFGGKTENFKSKKEKKFETKHLKAYKKGYKRFMSGIDITGNPIWNDVKEIWS